MTDPIRTALAELVRVLNERHYGRMPEELQSAFDAASAALAEQPSVTVDDILAEFDRRAEPGTGFYEPQEPAQIIRAMLAGRLAEYDLGDYTPRATEQPSVRERLKRQSKAHHEEVQALTTAHGAELSALREQLRVKREDECLTLQDWRIRAMDLEASWARCSQACAKLQGERDELREQLAQAVQMLHKARAGLSGGLWDYGPGQDEHDACDVLIDEIDAAIAATGEAKA